MIFEIAISKKLRLPYYTSRKYSSILKREVYDVEVLPDAPLAEICALKESERRIIDCAK
jgi:hypothetical protein